MKTLLLCGYRPKDQEELALGVTPSGYSLIDHRIEQLRALGQSIICVVAGAEADEQLRHSPQMQHTELVFDDSPHVDLLSNTRTGLSANGSEPCFILPVEIAWFPLTTWRFLTNEYGKLGFNVAYNFLQALNMAEGTQLHFEFPLLLTRTGAKVIQDTPDLQNLVDPRLKYLPLTRDQRCEADLAPQEKPL